MTPESVSEVLAWPTAVPTPLELHERRDDLLLTCQVTAWLIEAWPDAWYLGDESLLGIAMRLMLLRDRVELGRVPR